MQLAAPARALVRRDARRIVIVGARGWIGRTTLELLREALGEEFITRVVCFGSSATEITLDDGTMVPQRPLAELAALEPKPSLLLHLAFLTKDKVAGMAEQAYVEANRALSGKVMHALDTIGVDRLFLASSGAAAFADDPDAASDLRLYGRLKRDDENRFAAWAQGAPGGRRAAIGRIYSVSGPYINKHETYALASFLLDALAGRPIAVRAPMRVLRSFIPVRELVSFVMASLLAETGPPMLHFETGGDALELGEVAAAAAKLFGTSVDRRPITDLRDNRYVGDAAAWRDLLAGVGMTALPLDAQLAETAAWLAQHRGGTG